MLWFKWLVLAYLTIAAKLALAPYVTSYGHLPDPMLVIAVLALVTVDHPYTFALAGMIGLAGDFFWGERLGAAMLCLLVVGFFLGGLRRSFALEKPLRALAAASLVATALFLLHAVLEQFLRSRSLQWPALSTPVLADGCICGGVVYALHAVLTQSTRRIAAIFHAVAA